MNAYEPIEAFPATSPHQAAMNRMYRLQRHFYDASRHFYLLGRDRLIEDLQVPDGGTVLEAGCGTARNLLHVATRYPQARVFGFDISDEMLKSASVAVARAGLVDRVRIAQGDVLSFDGRKAFGTGTFDRVYFSYTLSMIPAWQDALDMAMRLLSPGGSLHIVDFGQCERLPHLFRRGLFAWLRQFHVSPRSDLGLEVERLAARYNATPRFRAEHRGYDWHFELQLPK